MTKVRFKKLAGNYQLWLMVFPALAYIIIFHYVPMYGIQLAFREFEFLKGITGGKWVGLKYIREYVKSANFGLTMGNTFFISLAGHVFGFPMPIILALAMNQIRNNRLKKTLQTTVTLPYFISTVVMVSMINIFLSPNNGLLQMALKGLRLIGPEANLLGDPAAFIPVYVISGIWQGCGWGSIIYLAALSNVDMETYDAAKIDGANKFQLVRYIELPTLAPTIVLLLILSTGSLLSVGFEKILLMQNGLNFEASEVISTYVYKRGIRGADFNLGAAIGLFNTVINFALLVISNQIAKRVSGTSLM